jgi:hypothetical protein
LINFYKKSFEILTLLFYFDENFLYSWTTTGLGDDFKNIGKPRPVPSIKDVPVVDLAVGGMHTLALCADGTVRIRLESKHEKVFNLWYSLFFLFLFFDL